jgi:aminomethyltransferase
MDWEADMLMTAGLAVLPPRPSTILRPGIPSLEPGVERYRVKGLGSIVIKVVAGDRVTVKDMEGCQPCELTFVGMNGSFNAAGLALPRFTHDAGGLKSILTSVEPSAGRTRAALSRRGVDLTKAHSTGF